MITIPSRNKRFSVEIKGGEALLISAVIALLAANSPLAHLYESLVGMSQPPLLFVVNDCLMSLFFLLVGLEIRKEILDGELNTPAKAVLPAIAAFGGIVVPALVYLLAVQGDPSATRGFGIPVATDIAFAVSVLGIFGARVPLSLKIFLLALAIFDDIGAILLIAFFYNQEMSVLWFLFASLTTLFMFALRKRKTGNLAIFLTLSIVLWIFTLRSGIHPTIAGVVAAFLLPIGKGDVKQRDAFWFKRKLQPWINFFVLPLFAFLNAGISFAGMGISDLLAPVSIGISLGLFVGKPVGIFLFTWFSVKFRIAPMPKGVSWLQILGVAAICGIGFTMSLFVGAIAFDSGHAVHQAWVRTGVLLGSLASALLGSMIIYLSVRKP